MKNSYGARRGVAATVLLTFMVVWLIAAIGGCGGSGSSTMTVAITSQPQSLSVSSGTAATFVVSTTGPNVSYQWFKDGVALTNATASTYTVDPTSSTSAGSYYVVVTNSSGSVRSNTVSLTVNVASGGSTVTVN